MPEEDKEDKCPCLKNKRQNTVKCTVCKKWWHQSCAGLAGLSADELGHLKDWKCPICYEPPDKVEIWSDMFTVKKVFNKLSELNESINTKAINVIEKVDKKSEEQVALWTDLFNQNRGANGNQLQEVVASVVEKSKQQMDSDHVEREKRKNNIVIRDVTESGAATPELRKTDDKQKLTEILGLNEVDVENVYRAGKADNPDRTGPRPLIITLKTPEMAMALHGHGRGRRYAHPDGGDRFLWCNPDLIDADRKANFAARQERRRMKARPGRPPPPANGAPAGDAQLPANGTPVGGGQPTANAVPVGDVLPAPGAPPTAGNVRRASFLADVPPVH